MLLLAWRTGSFAQVRSKRNSGSCVLNILSHFRTSQNYIFCTFGHGCSCLGALSSTEHG